MFRCWSGRGVLPLLTVLLLAHPVRPATGASNIFAVSPSGFSAYTINGVNNPTLRLVRGFTYTFNLSVSGHPFWIKTVQGTSSANAYTNGISGNGAQTGTLTFAVPTNAPGTLFYNCEFHGAMTGTIAIDDRPTIVVQSLDVSTNIVIRSTGTNTLNLRVATATNTAGPWVLTTAYSNSYANGTNTTTFALPASGTFLVRIRQGFP